MDTDGNIRGLSAILSSKFSLAAGTDGSGKGIVGLILLFILFVVCGAYFGGAESGFSAMNKIRIKAKADDGNKRAKTALFISNNFDKALTTLLIGNNITHIAAASVATVIATRLFGTSDTVTVLCTVITTLIVFLFSEMIPKSFANDRSETTALFAARSLRFLMKVLSPLAAFFSMISTGVTKLVSKFVKTTEEPSITEEELYDIIDTIEEEGVMNEEQGDLFKSALDFSGTRARDVMTMRADITAIDVHTPNDKILELIKNSNHSRIPVYDRDLDHMVGTLQIRTFIRAYLENPAVNIRSLLIAPFQVSPNALIDDLLSEMRQHKFYLAIVADETGETQGLVTIEDFLEELVGEIWDEDDVVDKNFVKLGGNRFEVNTRLTLNEACEKIGIPCPDRQKAARPILSILLEQFGRIPEEEETFQYYNLEFTVENVENNRVTTVVIRLLTDEDLETVAGDSAEPSAL